MKPETLDKYSKSIKDLKTFNQESKQIDDSRTTVQFEDSTFKIYFNDTWNNYLRSKLPKLEFTKEEQVTIGVLIKDIVTKKFISNHEEAKKQFKQEILESI